MVKNSGADLNAQDAQFFVTYFGLAVSFLSLSMIINLECFALGGAHFKAILHSTLCIRQLNCGSPRSFPYCSSIIVVRPEAAMSENSGIVRKSLSLQAASFSS